MEARVKYLLLVYLDESWDKRPLADRQEAYWGQMRATEELVARGQYLGGSALHPTSTATSAMTAARARSTRRTTI